MLQGGNLVVTGGIFLCKRRNSHATIIHALDLHNFPQEKNTLHIFSQEKNTKRCKFINYSLKTIQICRAFVFSFDIAKLLRLIDELKLGSKFGLQHLVSKF